MNHRGMKHDVQVGGKPMLGLDGVQNVSIGRTAQIVALDFVSKVGFAFDQVSGIAVLFNALRPVVTHKDIEGSRSCQ